MRRIWEIPFGLDFCRSENGERLLALCSDHQSFLPSTSFRRSTRRYVTWPPPSSNHPWTQIDHIAIGYKWRISLQDYRSYWSIPFDSDHALVCTKLPLCFDGRSKCALPHRLNCDKPFGPTCLSIFRSIVAKKLGLPPTRNINEYWSLFNNSMHSAGLVNCGLTRRFLTSLFSAPWCTPILRGWWWV